FQIGTSLFKAGRGVHSPNTHSDFTGFRPLLVPSISSTETSESRSSAALVALVCAYWSVHISCSWWNMVRTFAFFLRGSFDFARDAAESLSDALESSSKTGVFFGLYANHCLLHRNQVLFLVTRIRLDFYITVKGKPRVRFAVAFGGLVAIFTGSAFFLLRVCECNVRLPLWRSSHCRIY